MFRILPLQRKWYLCFIVPQLFIFAHSIQRVESEWRDRLYFSLHLSQVRLIKRLKIAQNALLPRCYVGELSSLMNFYPFSH